MFIEDRAPFFADFGEVATIGGSPVSVIFDKDFIASLEIESSNPVAVIDEADAAAVVHGTAVVIRSVNYTVVGIHPDGTGMTVLELEKV